MGKNYGWQSTIHDINQSKQSIEIQQPLWSVDLDLTLWPINDWFALILDIQNG